MRTDLRATRAERDRRLPGDQLVPDPDVVINNGISIDARPADIWPWLVQMGSGRAGWYAYDFVDNDGKPSATAVLPTLQQIDVGAVMPSLPGARDSFVIASYTPDRDLVLTVPRPDGKAGVSWEFYLQPELPRGTRLLVRGRVSRAWPAGMQAEAAPRPKRPIEFVYAVLARIPRRVMFPIALFGHDAMQARQMRGIKRRAEGTITSRPARWARMAAAAGCVGALGYGGLKALWALGVTVGIDKPAHLRPAGTSTGEWALENLATTGLAALAALILLGLVQPRITAVPALILRTLGWLGTIMVVPGVAGLALILDYMAGTHLFPPTNLGGVSPVTYVFVYACFLTLGLAFAATSLLTMWPNSQQHRRLEPTTGGGSTSGTEGDATDDAIPTAMPSVRPGST